jgi:hypothetical protein
MKVLSDLFTLDSTTLDPRISTSLLTCVNSVAHGSELSLTAIGRNTGELHSRSEKHAIKRVDRLLKNTKLHDVRCKYYQMIASYFAGIKHPLIHIDWSTVYNYNFVMLRAAVSVDGRAITIYEEVYAEEMHCSPIAHKTFISNLAKILPAHAVPIICTDAGFKIPWFKLIESYNWYWLARTRGEVKCLLEGDINWLAVHKHHHKATNKASELPQVILSMSHEHPCRGVLFKGKNMQRKNLNRKGVVTKDRSNMKHAKSANEPWFLVSNLPKEQYFPHQLVNLYRRRMGIEESFRDCKNEYYGMGLRRSRSRNSERLQIILLIAMLALFYLLMLGRAAETEGFQRHFQANTTKRKRVLSYAFLGRRIIHHKEYDVSEELLISAFSALIEESFYE